MADKPESRRANLEFRARQPDGSWQPVYIAHRRLRTMAQRGQAHVLEAARIVPMILSEPSAIFEGVRTEEDDDLGQGSAEGWRCYCGIPRVAYTNEGHEIPPYLDQVYLVFLNTDRIAYNWRWEPADPNHPTLPIDHPRRFARQVL